MDIKQFNTFSADDLGDLSKEELTSMFRQAAEANEQNAEHYEELVSAYREAEDAQSELSDLREEVSEFKEGLAEEAANRTPFSKERYLTDQFSLTDVARAASYEVEQEGTEESKFSEPNRSEAGDPPEGSDFSETIRKNVFSEFGMPTEDK